MPVIPLITLLERQPGVILPAALQPSSLVLTPTAGENELQVQWSKASGLTAKELIVIRYEAAPIDGAGSVLVQWGDGDTEKHSLGWIVDLELQHTYTSSGSKTITVTIQYKQIDVEEEVTLDLTIATSGDLLADQIQIEKYEDGVLIFEPDWYPISKLPTTYVDDRVNRAHSYRYRYRLRSLDSAKQTLVTSQFSNVTEQPAWS